MADESFNLVTITFTKCAELVRLDNDYNKSISLISRLKNKLKENSKEMITGLREHGEDWHREINAVVNNLEVELELNAPVNSLISMNKKMNSITQ